MNEQISVGSLQQRCKYLEQDRPLTTRQILEPFGLLAGHPWADMAASDLTTYYSCLHGTVQPERPRKILEIGAAFGMSSATFLTASAGVELFVSLDLGIYGEQLGNSQGNIEFAREHIHGWCIANHIDTRRVRYYQANTQPPGEGDNANLGLEVSRWSLIPDVVRLLEDTQFDIIFVDGKHTEDGLLNDLRTFWRFLKPGGLAICDDLHEPEQYAGAFSWVGHTWQSYHRFLEEAKAEIAEHCIWNFPRVPPADKMGLRPFGLLRKAANAGPQDKPAEFGMFDSADAMAINHARQDHLASLGLDLANRSVLEVGAGIGWHTAFFERLGCRVLSTDARPGNVHENLRRHPNRQGRVECADLALAGSHARFGKFDVVYCYGTLYHVNDSALCLAEVAGSCAHVLLLETVVNPTDNGQTNVVAEDAANPNQSFHGQGCRPGRDWVIKELKRHFPHVYVSRTQPDYPDFSNRWPATPRPGVINARAVFVASREPLDLPTLSAVLPSEQVTLRSVLDVQAPTTATGLNHAPAPMADASVLFDVGPGAAFKGLESNIYGRRSPDELVWRDHALFFSPSTDRDHFATPFRDLRFPANASAGWAFLDVRFPDGHARKHMAVSVQDRGFSTLATTQDSGELKRIRLPRNCGALRLCFSAPSGEPCLFPEQARLSVAFIESTTSESRTHQSSNDNPASPVVTAVRERIGRLMGQDCAASPGEMEEADDFIARFLRSDRPGEMLADAQNPIPKPVPALLLHAWNQALLNRKDDAYVQGLERLYGFLHNAQQAQLISNQPLPDKVQTVAV